MNEREEIWDKWSTIGHEFQQMRRKLDELIVAQLADANGSLSELNAVLKLKRGCRRG